MKHLLSLILALVLAPLATAQLPNDTKQVIIGITNGWNSSHVTLSLFEKQRNKWIQIGKPWKGRIGKNGLAWGRGLHPLPTSGKIKKEGDGRAPAGIFNIGGAYGYAKNIAKLRNQPYRQITTRDLWVEDSKSPYYNRHIILDHEPKNTWEKRAQMRQGDYAHALKLFIAHNAPTATRKAKPYAGSSIFFHIWRGGGSRPTSGCTTMHPQQLKWLISKINPAKHPRYILLPSAEYSKLRSAWKLP